METALIESMLAKVEVDCSVLNRGVSGQSSKCTVKKHGLKTAAAVIGRNI